MATPDHVSPPGLLPFGAGTISGPGLPTVVRDPVDAHALLAVALARSGAPEIEPVESLREVRAVFWQNVLRELLVGLPAVASHRPEVMDGRIALLTRSGERIPIASADPCFPCSLSNHESQRLCMAIQCTVFQIRTPSGEVFLLPLEEIRGVHTITEELLREIEAASRIGEEPDAALPFGFAAFSAMARDKSSRNESPNDAKS